MRARADVLASPNWNVHISPGVIYILYDRFNILDVFASHPDYSRWLSRLMHDEICPALDG